MATKSKRIRDYRKEYHARIARGLASGKSRASARGHARATDQKAAKAVPVDKNNPLERALKLMKQGVGQKTAARMVGVSTERLRRYQNQNTTSMRVGRQWIIIDPRPVTVVMATLGKMRTVAVSHDAASDIGKHWNAVNLFLETNDLSHLAPFKGLGLRDVVGRFHPFETRPNVLRRLDSAGELSFIDIYRQTAQ